MAALPAIVTVNDLDSATLTVVGNKVVARDPTKAPLNITAATVTAAPIAAGDTVDVAASKLQAQITAGLGGGLILKQTIGGSASIAVVHGFNTTDVAVEVYEISSGLTVYPGVIRTSVNAIRLDFGSQAIAANSHRVIVQGFA